MSRRRYTPPPVLAPVASAPAAQISTPGLAEQYREAQRHARTFNDRLGTVRRLEQDVEQADARADRWAKLGWLGGWARSKSARWSEDAQRLDMRRVELEAEAEAARLETQFHIGDSESESWIRLGVAFETLCTADRVWDVTARGASEHYKSSATQSIDRRPVRIGYGLLPTVRPDVRALHFGNANGPDLWMYPSLLAVGDSRDAPALVDLREVTLGFSELRFIEEERLPIDSDRVGSTWRYVNKDGGPDRRFADNPQIPVVLYGQIDLTSPGGLCERFHVSDASKAATFADALGRHLSGVRSGLIG